VRHIDVATPLCWSEKGKSGRNRNAPNIIPRHWGGAALVVFKEGEEKTDCMDGEPSPRERGRIPGRSTSPVGAEGKEGQERLSWRYRPGSLEETRDIPHPVRDKDPEESMTFQEKRGGVVTASSRADRVARGREGGKTQGPTRRWGGGKQQSFSHFEEACSSLAEGLDRFKGGKKGRIKDSPPNCEARRGALHTPFFKREKEKDRR